MTEQERKERQDELGVCLIRRTEEGQNPETLASGFVVKNLEISQGFPQPYCLISSTKAFPNDCNIKQYSLVFKTLNKNKLETFQLANIAISDKINRNLYSGLVVIPIKPSKKCKEKKSIFASRPFEVTSEERRTNQNLRCHFVDDGNQVFSVKEMKLSVRQSRTVPVQYQLQEGLDGPCTTYNDVVVRGDRKPYGAAILKRINNNKEYTYMVVGALTFSDDDRRDISPVFFLDSTGRCKSCLLHSIYHEIPLLAYLH